MTTESELLRLILADTVRVEAMTEFRADYPNDAAWCESIEARRDIDDLGVRIAGEWIGSDPASRKARQRGLESLERRGLVELHSVTGNRTTHAKMTQQGRVLAERENPTIKAPPAAKPARKSKKAAR